MSTLRFIIILSGHKTSFVIPRSYRILRGIPYAAIRLACLSCLFITTLGADETPLRIAVAANFSATAETLSVQFEATYGIGVHLVSGSSGKHATQITYGAPFDVFLSADRAKPAALHARGLSANTPRTYARGQLAVIVPIDAKDSAVEWLIQSTEQRIVIANPRVAPYGEAAQYLLDRWSIDRSRVVSAENVSQAYQLVLSGNVDAAIIALPQLKAKPLPSHLGAWTPDSSTYPPIEQDVVLINNDRDDPAAQHFVEFLLGSQAQTVIHRAGYLAPEADDAQP
ncbi:MAG: molybdate ABC transporter substrate-binding protein [Pseudomonadota bacterium]